MTDDDLPDLLRIAEQAVGLGYDIIKNTTPSEIRLKSDRDTVTDVDLKIENKVREFLRRMTPKVGFLGEEEISAASLDEDQDVWTLDPVDGTSNFAHGLPLCAISLALVRRGTPVIATITAPFMELHYTAAKGFGAYGNGVQLHASGTKNISQAIVSLGDYAVGRNAAEKNQRRIHITTLLAERVERIRMFGSAALDLAWVAEGRTDATVILANKPWDTAAGVLIAREAGALVVDASGSPHSFTSTETIGVSRGIVAPLLALVNSNRNT